MATRSGPAAGDLSISEIKEFAGFPAATQRYIRRSLDIGLEREDAIARWSRDMVEETAIRVQAKVYQRIGDIRAHIPDDSGLDALEGFMAPLVAVSAFDLGQDRLPGFASYRFLYERLLGAHARLRGRGHHGRELAAAAVEHGQGIPGLQPQHAAQMLRLVGGQIDLGADLVGVWSIEPRVHLA